MKKKLIKFENFNSQKFLEEFSQLNVSNESIISLNSQIIRNLVLFFELAEKNNLVSFSFKKDLGLDFLGWRSLKKHFGKDFLKYFNKFKFKFVGFSEKELLELIPYPYYFRYCYEFNLEVSHNKKLYEKEKKKLLINWRLFFKYKSLRVFFQYFKKYPYSSFNFPVEKNKDRFVFYFYIFNEKRKNAFIDIIKKNNLNIPDLNNFIEKMPIYDKIAGYALGFVYNKNKQLERVTLYTYILYPHDTIGNIHFINKTHNLDLDYNNFSNIWAYGIDYYILPKRYKEIKIYSEPYIFNREISNRILNDIFYKKVCTYVIKIRDFKIVDEKYEFLYSVFNSNEIESLKRFNLFEKNSKTLSIYLNEGGNIKRTVNYNV